MALNVTPSSGAGPYYLSATVSNAEMIDGVNYSASLLSTTSEGSCPPAGTSNPLSPSLLASLLSGDSLELTSSIAEGSCRTYTLAITDVSENIVVSSSNASVDNVDP